MIRPVITTVLPNCGVLGGLGLAKAMATLQHWLLISLFLATLQLLWFVAACHILGVGFLLPMYALLSVITLRALAIWDRIYVPFGLPTPSTQEPWPWLTCSNI